MARPINPNSQYIVHVGNNGKYTYAYSQMPSTNQETGKKQWRKIHWGTVDDNKVFHPYTRYFTYEDRGLLVFPEDCDLSEAKALLKPAKPTCQPTKTRDDVSNQYVNKLHGDVWLLDRIADHMGIKKDLVNVFADNVERVKRIMTIAYYIISHSESLNHIARWQNIEKVPTDYKLTPTAVTELVQSITENHRMRLLKLRAAREDMSSRDFCATDTSTITCDSENLSEVKMGYSKDGGKMLQTIIVVVYSLTTHIPVYYDIIQGNMPDSRGLDQICRTVESAGFLGIVFITDRGYFTFDNIKKFLTEKKSAIMAAKTSDSFIKNIIKEIRLEDGCIPQGMDIDHEKNIYYKQYKLSPGMISPTLTSQKKYVYLNLYFNPIMRSNYVTNLMATVEYERQRLEQILRDKEIVDKASIGRECRHYNITFYKNSNRVRSFELNKEKINEEKMLVGYFANLEVNLKMTAIEAHEHYKLRDEQEKCFEGRKTRFNFDRIRCSTEESIRGREFILFIAAIILSYLRKLWREKIKTNKILLRKYPTEIDILDEMRSIRYIEYEGQDGYMTPFVGSQVELCNLFGFAIPKGCEPKSKIKK